MAVVARSFLAVLAILTVSACAARPTFETVLPVNATLEAHTPSGFVRVTAVSPDTRRYVWAGRDVTVTLSARQSRWFGTLGLYDADADLPGSSTITRGVLLESQRHFTNLGKPSGFCSYQKTLYTRSSGRAMGWPSRTARSLNASN